MQQTRIMLNELPTLTIGGPQNCLGMVSSLASGAIIDASAEHHWHLLIQCQ